MKVFSLLTVFLLVLHSSHGAQPYFPPQIFFFANDVTLYAIDEVNQRAYKSFSQSTRQSETAYALKNFPFAPPDSPQSKNYVQLREGFPNIGCVYATYWQYGGSTFNAFPSHWSNGTSFEIKNFMGFKYPMIRSNASSAYEDYWYSNETCHPQSPKPVPCEEIYFRKGTDIPLRSTQVITTPWEVEQFTTTYTVITIGPPEAKYFNSMPKNWASSCRDVTLGVSYAPQSTTVNVKETVNVQVWLPAPPHRVDGNDTMTIRWKTDGCEDCVTWKPKQLAFTAKDFQVRQTVKITRVKSGAQTNLVPIFQGGGFENVSTTNLTITIE